MYKTFTKSKSILTAMVLSLAMLATTNALAGPGRPGENPYAPGGNIVDVAIAANAATGLFNTVLAAATCPYFGGLVVNLLSGEDKVTLFAPIDPAFAELGLNAGNVCDTFEGNPEVLLTILAYHVTDGRRASNSLFNANSWKEVEMLIGGSISTYVDGDMPKIEDNAGNETTVIIPNINAINGYIHVVDGVLILEAELKHEAKEEEEGKFLRQERRYGKLMRRFNLGEGVNENDIDARFENGVLHLKAPKHMVERIAKEHRIAIH